MSYSEKEVVGMLTEVGDSFNLYKGKMETRFTALEQQSDAIEKAVAKADGQFGGALPSKGVYANVGDQLRDVAAVARPGGDPAAREKLLKVMAQSTGLGESVPSDGGFLIQKDFSTELVSKAVQSSLLQPRCFNIKLSANSNGVTLPLLNETSRANGSRFGGIETFWTAESAPATKSKPTFRQVQMNLHKLTGLCYASDELLQDSAVLGRVISAGFASELAFRVDDAIFNGPGAGQPMGIMNSGCLVTINKESGQTAGTILYENIVKMYSRLAASSEANAVWLINRNIIPQLYTMSLGTGLAGVPVFMPAGGAAMQPYSTLMGKPILCIEQAATLGTVGDIVLADLSQYLWIEKGIEEATSIHVQFIYSEMTYRFVLRCDGMPMAAAALIPYKGALTTSPFVALQTR